jgi:hypothetical protein
MNFKNDSKVRFIIYFVLFIINLNQTNSRIHHLTLQNDNRQQVTISSFGFLKNGLFQVKVDKFSFNPLNDIENIKNSFFFVLEKSKSGGSGGGGSGSGNTNGYSSFTVNSKKRNLCEDIEASYSKNESTKTTPLDGYSLILFNIDLIDRVVYFKTFGTDMKSLYVNSNFNYHRGLSLFNGNHTAQPLSIEQQQQQRQKQQQNSLNSLKLDYITNSSVSFQVK